eukprot:c20139_g1_i1.p1 GENE.c20139_g1_i1~~c20139_g1_i1.p1  ORF type:complete len:252 (-),score=57.81 c20139_g1_i1:326-1042(-)
MGDDEDFVIPAIERLKTRLEQAIQAKSQKVQHLERQVGSQLRAQVTQTQPDQSSDTSSDELKSQIEKISRLTGIRFDHFRCETQPNNNSRTYRLHGKLASFAFGVEFTFDNKSRAISRLTTTLPAAVLADLRGVVREWEDKKALRDLFRGLAAYSELRDARKRVLVHLCAVFQNQIILPHGPSRSSSLTFKCHEDVDINLFWTYTLAKSGSLIENVRFSVFFASPGRSSLQFTAADYL